MDMQDRTLPFFRSPADQATRDLAGQPALLAEFAALWNDYLNGFSQQAIVGNPWQASNSADTPYYYNPLTTTIPAASRAKAIQWSAMPGRIAYYNEADWNSQLSATQINQLADFGWQPNPGAANRASFPDITTDPCSGLPGRKLFGPMARADGWTNIASGAYSATRRPTRYCGSILPVRIPNTGMPCGKSSRTKCWPCTARH